MRAYLRPNELREELCMKVLFFRGSKHAHDTITSLLIISSLDFPKRLAAAYPIKVREKRFDVSTNVRTIDVRLQEGKARVDPKDHESVRGDLGLHVHVHLRRNQAIQTPHEEDRGIVPCLYGEEHWKVRAVMRGF